MGNWYKYLAEEEGFSKVCENKTKKQFKNALRIVYGKKKDRGHLKQRIKAYNEDAEKLRKVIDEAMEKRFGYSFSSLLRSFGGGLY